MPSQTDHILDRLSATVFMHEPPQRFVDRRLLRAKTDGSHRLGEEIVVNVDIRPHGKPRVYQSSQSYTSNLPEANVDP